MSNQDAPRTPEKPWIMRTYSGHSSAKASNELYRTNLAKGQTGLSIAFDLPTQLGYDPDDPRASGEVGKVGVPVAHLGHMDQLLEGIPVDKMNTSMTINATAMWLLALYIAHAKKAGVDPKVLQGTTQNDIVKEYLSRGTYVFPPGPSRRLTVDLITYTLRNVPKWNPINVCSYHLQEAGATPVQEIAYALATATGVLDAVRDSGRVHEGEMAQVFGRMSFFCNSGVRFIEETCKMRAFNSLWDRLGKERYGVEDPKLRRFRYGVQVNSLGLTEAQPENNIPRIVLEALGVTLSKSARARALQLPAWNEALGLPRPWDQQWSLRIQQILAYETDLLEYEDIFDGSKVIEAKTSELAEAAWEELLRIEDQGGVWACIDELKASLVASQAERLRKIETGELKVVGVNCFTETAPSPLLAPGAGAIVGDGRVGTAQSEEEAILRVDPEVERELANEVAAWRSHRDQGAVSKALDELRRAARDETANLMEPSIALALAGGTTGEWAEALREVFGEYRGPTGVQGAIGSLSRELASVKDRVEQIFGENRPRILVAKPGLDGHSNGAEAIAVAARDAGFEVVYQGIRQTPEQIAAAARDEDVDLVGISILSGSHMELVPRVLSALASQGVDSPVVVGGIVPEEDQPALARLGVARIYTPKDYDLARIMDDLVSLAHQHRSEAAVA